MYGNLLGSLYFGSLCSCLVGLDELASALAATYNNVVTTLARTELSGLYTLMASVMPHAGFRGRSHVCIFKEDHILLGGKHLLYSVEICALIGLAGGIALLAHLALLGLGSLLRLCGTGLALLYASFLDILNFRLLGLGKCDAFKEYRAAFAGLGALLGIITYSLGITVCHRAILVAGLRILSGSGESEE